MLMLVAATAFIVVTHPPVSVADLLVTAYARPSKPQYGTEEDAQHRAMGEVLWEVKLR